MSRSRRDDSPSVALFPFLAVLMSAMGALLLLLVLITQHARSEAEDESRAKQTEGGASAADIHRRREDVELLISQYESARDATAVQLAERRAELSHLEDHTRRLRERAAELRAAVTAIEQSAATTENERAERDARLARLKQQAAEIDARIQQATKDAKAQRDAYAIIPYVGPNGTRRRPIYIECAIDGVILQPEGVRLIQEDFEGPQGPGNPLAAALRATIEHLGRDPQFASGAEGAPYPLLVVRPEGIVAYYAARAAMKSWGDEFGYELVDSDWELALGPPDRDLAVAQMAAIELARKKQLQLMAAAPRALRREGSGFSDGFGPGVGFGKAGAGFGSAAGGGTGSAAIGTGATGGASGLPGTGSRGAATGSFAGAAQGGPSGTGAAGGGATNGHSPSASSSSGNPAAGQGGAGGDSAAASGRPGGQGTGPGGASSANGGGPAAVPPEQPIPARPGAYLEGANDARRGAASPNGSAGSAGGEQSPESSAGQTASAVVSVRSLAEKRGKDWGLQDANRNWTPVTRYVRIECRGDRLTLLPENPRDTGGQVVAYRGGAERAADELVSHVQTRIRGWGIAGNRMYWRPILVVDVAPDGEVRFEELRVLLHDSGMEVRRKQTAEAPSPRIVNPRAVGVADRLEAPEGITP